jgi:hypothetical protein
MSIPENMLPVEEFAKTKGIDPAKVVSMIRDGFYVGQLVDEKWYVSRGELSSSGKSTTNTVESLTSRRDVSSSATPSGSLIPERGNAILALRIFAWLDLVAGIIGAIVIWANFGSVEVPIFAGSTITRDQANPIGISVGIALLAQGIFLFTLFLVVAGGAEDAAAIRNKVES